MIFVFSISLLNGFLCAWTGRMIDSMMDYGKIFDFVRVYFARRASKRAGVNEYFEKEIIRIKAIEDFSERINEADNLFWKMAAKDKTFVSWVCVQCLTIQKVVTLSMLFFLFFNMSVWWLPVYFFMSALTAFTTLILSE